MKFKRIGRVLVCLLLVSVLLINASPIKAKATGAVIAAPIVKAATVTLNPYIVAGAIVLALGIGAVAENPQAFQNVVDAGVSALESAGTWVKDGMVELLRTEDADGKANYYVNSGLMESVRSDLLNKGTVYEGISLGGTKVSLSTNASKAYNMAIKNPYVYIASSSSGNPMFFGGQRPFVIENGVLKTPGYQFIFYSYNSVNSIITQQALSAYNFASSGVSPGYSIDTSFYSGHASDSDVHVSNFPSVPVDGTSARQWSEEYTDRGLKVYGGGSGNNNNDGKWFWPLALTLTAAELYAMSQADEWSGQTPQEFDDYTTKTEYEILSQPEIEFGHGIEIQPVTSPTPDSGGGTDPTQPGEGDNPGESTQPTTPGGLPDIGGGDNPDPGTTPDVNTDYSSWFSKLYTVVQNIQGKLEEIPNRFQSWITDCKTAIEELPSKFAEWFNNIASELERIIEGITTLGQNFAQNLQTLGQNIVEGIRTALSSLFSPSPDYFTNKVEALKAKHHNIDKFNQLGNDFKLFFTGLGSKPPIIWIDLGAATGAYLWGGRQIFLDLTWYADYKPKMDAILGAIIWLWLAWRVFLSVPGIINGASGVWGKYHRGGSRDDN